MEMDDEEKARRITGCLDGLAYLLSGTTPGMSIEAQHLHPMIELFAEEAHRLLDPPETPFRGIKSND